MSRRAWLRWAKFAVAALLLIGASWAATRPLLAATIEDDGYAGVTSDLASFQLRMFEGGDGVTSIELGAPPKAFPNSCLTLGNIVLEGVVFNRGRLTSIASDITFNDPSTGELRVLRISGRIYRDGIVTGDISISGFANQEGITCTPRSFSWIAIARVTNEVPIAGARYQGTMIAGQTLGALSESGTASLSITADGQSMTGFALTPTQTCAATDFATTVAPLTSGLASLREERPGAPGIAFAEYRVAIAGRSALGAYTIDRDQVGCPPLAGIFIAEASSTSTATPTGTAAATPTPAGALPGTFAAPPVFPPTGARLAQVVFTGGTVSQLDTALNAANASGAWAQSANGTFFLYIVGAPAFVNVPFREAFPAGFTTTTALTVTGR